MITRNTMRKTPILMAGAAAVALGVVGAGAIGTEAAQAPRLTPPTTSADGTLSFADLVEQVSPAVVSVRVEREAPRPQIPSQLEEFFNFRFGPEGPQGERDPFGGEAPRARGEGSGFFIDDEGHIVTNNHVVDGAVEVRVRLADDREIDAEIVGVDPLTDLAVLKVDPPARQAYVEFATDVKLRVGDWVVAVGNPFGLGGTVTSGIISAIGGQNRETQYSDYIQIDAPINRGNSGGPTFDLKGRVVGVNTAIFSPTGGSVGIGFAIPAKVASETVAQLIANGAVTRGWLGISLDEVTMELAAALDLDEKRGVLVNDVIEDTPAASAGLEAGDVIIEVGGDRVDTPNELSRLVASLQPGRKVKLGVLRDGRERTVNVTLGERDDAQQVAETRSANDNEDTLSSEVGLRVSELNDALRQQFRVPDGVDGVVVTGVRPGSPAQEAGLQRGALILQVEGEDVSDPKALKNKIDKAREDGKDAILMRLQYGPNRQFAALSLEG